MAKSTPTAHHSSMIGLVVVALAAIAGSCALWQIWEQDLFWQIRAGQFTAQNGGPAHSELWSYTAHGKPWIDIQWLANLFLYGVFKTWGETGLVALRGLLSLALFSVVGCLVARRESLESETTRISLLLVLVPLTFCALAFRIQLRPDFLLMITAAGILALWEAAPVKTPIKVWITLGLLLLGANLHAGTMPYLILIAGAYLATQPMALPLRITALVIAPLTLFVTPSHWQILPFIFDAAKYSQGSLISNPDFMSVGALHFDPRVMGWTGWAWVTLMVLALLGLIPRFSARPRLETILFTLVFSLLTLSGLRLDRSLPYQIIFALPFALDGLRRALLWLSPPMRDRAGFALGVILLIGMVQSAGFGYSLFNWGFDLNPRVFPTGAARFLQQTKPVGPIYHVPEYGNYMVTFLTDYPVFADTRDLLYSDHYQLMQDSYRRPDKTQELVEKFGINVFWMPNHRISLTKSNEFVDRVREFYPPENWALVDFDHLSMILVKRIPEHAELIAQNEYRHLKPHLPPDHYLFAQKRSKEEDQLFLGEVARCLKNHPDLPHCWAAKSAWIRSSGDKNEAPTVFARLEELLESWPNHLSLRMELLNYYRILERKEDVLDTEKKIKELIYSPALRQ